MKLVKIIAPIVLANTGFSVAWLAIADDLSYLAAFGGMLFGAAFMYGLLGR